MPMNADTIAALMMEIPMFDQLDNEQRGVMAKFVEYSFMEEGGVLFREGQQGNSMYYIISGKVSIIVESMTGQKKSLALRKRGTTIGEMALVEGNTLRSATTICAEDSEFLYLSRENFETLCDKYPAIGVKVLRNIAAQLSARLKHASGKLADL